MIADHDLLAAVGRAMPGALGVMRFVHAHPELGHEERECSAHVAGVLEQAGFTLERGVAGMETAFVARLAGSRPGRTVGLVCLYDAVPAVRPNGEMEAVHSCGHGPISGGVTAAATGLASLRDDLAGEVRVYGCPSDEIHAPGSALHGGGKLLSAQGGIWDDVDAALYAHPEFIDTVSLESRWMRREFATVSGSRSLTGDPEPPLRAAAALIGANAVDVMVEHLELDGDVEEGTGLACSARVLVFADTPDELEERCSALRGVLPDAEWRSGPTVEGIRPDEHARAAVAAAMDAAGRNFVADPPRLPFATDFGNISRRAPAALIGIGREGGWAFHSDEGAEQFASADGEAAALAVAQVLALAAARLTENA
ncbi:MAG TPA: M20/M25/M40 family metallo-hydrolase [Gaiellaceae bacterium]|nr:M20/M25/M40 family metallo-hydrolase [Gaiellaceae bacterium]